MKQNTFKDTLSTDRQAVAGVLPPQSGNLRWTLNYDIFSGELQRI